MPDVMWEKLFQYGLAGIMIAYFLWQDNLSKKERAKKELLEEAYRKEEKEDARQREETCNKHNIEVLEPLVRQNIAAYKAILIYLKSKGVHSKISEEDETAIINRFDKGQ